MTKPNFETYNINISTLSPVHIGSGEDYEITNYLMQDGALYHFSQDTFAKSLSPQDREKLLEATNSRNPFTSVQKFILNKSKNLIDHPETKKIPATADTVATYNKQKENTKLNNSNLLQIERTSFHPHTNLPYFPGSSIKGAVRTALLNDRLNQNPILKNQKFSTYHRDQSKELAILTRQLLEGSFATDPLRNIKFSDANHQLKEGRPATNIRHQINKYKIDSTKNPKQGLDLPLEVMPEKQDLAYRGQLTLVETPTSFKAKDGENAITPSFNYTKDSLVEACNKYYLKEWQREKTLLLKYNIVDTSWVEWMDTRLTDKLQLIQNNNGMLLRIGKHTGAETITLDDIAQIKIMQGKGNPPKYKTTTNTIWLAGQSKHDNKNLLPFGWVFVELIQ